MAVKMRLMRMGKKRSAYYRVVVIDGRAPRDGRYIDLIGRYDPNQDPSLIEIDNDKAISWMQKGAQPTEPVAKLLEISGAMSRYKIAAGKIHTVPAKEPVEVTAAAAATAVAAAVAVAAEPEPAELEAEAAETAAETDGGEEE
ncbi:MAG: 30S ribosomal protein S16 [Acidimicrobiia bacterium]